MTKETTQNLIRLLPYQETAFWIGLRTMFFLWARQRGKSYLIAAKAIDRMLERSGRSCFFVSASIATGKEIVEKEAQIWHDALAALRAQQESLGKELGGNVVDKRSHQLLDVDDLADLMDKQTAQIRIYHSRTSYSRTKILAPNPDTARGWTGDIFGDEVGFWPDFRAVLDAVEPIVSRNSDYLMWMFTTPPEDDKHFIYDFLNPGALEFEPNARGNFYRTDAGYPVHRVDIYDSEKAGLSLFDPIMGEPVDYETYRAHAMDKASADRNYALKFVQGGSSAVHLSWLTKAMYKGAQGCIGIDLSKEVLSA